MTSIGTVAVPARWGALAFLLAAECAAFRIGFDLGTIGAAAGWWGGLMGEVTPLHQAAITTAFAAGLFFLGRPRLKRVVGRILDEARTDRHWRTWAAAQLVGFAGVVAVAVVLRAKHVESAPALVLLQGFGLALTTASLLFWLLSIAPAHTWRRVVAQEWRHWLLAGLVGGAWAAGTFTQRSWPRHSGPTLFVVEQILGWMTPQVISVPGRQVVGVPGFLIRISPQCSGYEGLGLVCVLLAVFFGVFFKKLRFPQAWLLWPIGVACIWLGNAVRIAALVMVGKVWSHDIAIRGFHSETGWIFFHLVTLGLLAAALQWRCSSHHPPKAL